MWENYGRILSEYMFIKNFRNSKYKKFLTIEGQEILNELKDSKEPVVFISGHFNNFELMAMQIEKSGINLAAIYRPLNNIFLNKIMEKIRTKYICRKQIKKGGSGTRKLLESFNKITDCPVLLNTSFNVKGQPIVNTPGDAIDCFLSTNIDTLAIGNFIAEKEDN